MSPTWLGKDRAASSNCTDLVHAVITPFAGTQVLYADSFHVVARTMWRGRILKAFPLASMFPNYGRQAGEQCSQEPGQIQGHG